MKLCKAPRLSPQLYRKKVHYSKLFNMVHTNDILWSKVEELLVPEDPFIFFLLFSLCEIHKCNKNVFFFFHLLI